MSGGYRVEVSPNNRAGCKDALCKKNGVKIMKGEIRFGVYVQGLSQGGHEFSGWNWRHWGCVSGKTLQNVRENLTVASKDEGQYNWEYLDGLEEMPQEFQDKIKLAITIGKIADEDWNGDPEYNVLGKTGIRGRTPAKKKNAEEGEEGQGNAAAPETPSKPATKKRGRGKKDEEEDEDAKPVKKRAIKAKREDETKEEKDAKPAKKRAIKTKKEDDEDEEEKPAKMPQAKRATKKEEDEEAGLIKREEKIETAAIVKPARKPRVKKEAKKEENDKVIKHENDPELDVKQAKKGRGEAVKKEENTGVKMENDDEAIVDIKPLKKPRGKKVTKAEESAKDNGVKIEANDEVNADVKPARKPRAKKGVKKEKYDETSGLKKEDGDEDNIKPVFKNEGNSAIRDVKKEKENDEDVDINGADMPADPLQRIALGYCDRDGPLVADFNDMVAAEEVADDDFGGFLQKKFQQMVSAGEVADNDWDGFLQNMHAREVAALQPAVSEPKKDRKAKKATTTAAKPRARRGKAP